MWERIAHVRFRFWLASDTSLSRSSLKEPALVLCNNFIGRRRKSEAEHLGEMCSKQGEAFIIF